MEVTSFFKLSTDAFQTTVSLVDHVWAVLPPRRMPSGRIQTMGVACLHISAKFRFAGTYAIPTISLMVWVPAPP